jgi:hypothetical protein
MWNSNSSFGCASESSFCSNITIDAEGNVRQEWTRTAATVRSLPIVYAKNTTKTRIVSIVTSQNYVPCVIPTLQRSYFESRMSLVETSARKALVLTECFRGFPLTLKASTAIASLNKPRPPASVAFEIHCS